MIIVIYANYWFEELQSTVKIYNESLIKNAMNKLNDLIALLIMLILVS